MENKEQISASKIITAFRSMDYYEDPYESIEDAKIWLKSNETIWFKVNEEIADYLTNKCSKSHEILTTVSKSFCLTNNIHPILSNFDKTCEMLKIADEIENGKLAQLICQLEMCIRGFSSRKTMKSLKYFAEMLRYYSGLTYTKNFKIFCTGLDFKLRDNESLDNISRYLVPALSQNQTIILFVPPNVVPLMVLLNKIISSHRFFNFKLELATGKVVLDNLPVIVFQNADLDSAIESILNSMNNLTVNSIFIQEEIFNEFVDKMKHRLKKLKIGFANDKTADVNYPALANDCVSKLACLKLEVQSVGIEVFPNEYSELYQPTMLIGLFLPENDFKLDQIEFPVLILSAFRHHKEAIAMANKLQEKSQAAIWSINMELSNYIAEKLNFPTIMINRGLDLEPDVPFFSEVKAGVSNFSEVFDKSLISSAMACLKGWESLCYKTRCQKLRTAAIALKELQSKDGEVWCELLIKMSSRNSQKCYVGENFEVKYVGKVHDVIQCNLEEVNECTVEFIMKEIINGSFVYVFVDNVTEVLQKLETYLPIKALKSKGILAGKPIYTNNMKAIWISKKR